ncbi:CgeB family protein [Priestia megaterium]
MNKKYNESNRNLNHLDPSTVTKNSLLDLDKDKWHTTHIQSVELFNKEGSLCINHQNITVPHFYVSYLEKNSNFSILPTVECEISPGKTYSVEFYGNVDKEVNMELFLIYYTNQTKVHTESFTLNTTSSLVIGNDVEGIRVAVRISGKGTSFINKIQFTDKSNKVKLTENTPKVETVSTEKHEWEQVINSKEILNESWFLENSCFVKDFNFSTAKLSVSINFPENKFQYISYYEQNINFKQKPSLFKIEINPKYRYQVSFQGKSQNTAIVHLFLIFYSKEGKREQIETFSLNEKRSIRILNSIDSFRIALKVSGEGSIDIEEIEINRRLNSNFSPLASLENAESILPSNLKKLKMAIICDTFTMQCLQPECELITFSPEDWRTVLSINPPHVLFVESAWEGNHGKWTRKVAASNDASIIDLLELIEWCKEKKIPTIFWNKEDPIHFNSFIKTAQHFDYIFTTDQDSVEKYKKRLKHNKVYSLPFAAQPKIHNPIEIYERENSICFAGSYYAKQYIKRQKGMDMLFEVASQHGLTIYDRNHGKSLIEFDFPKHLQKYIEGRLDPNQIDKAYKGYKIALNVNSVVNSPTMFSRRVFECLASNTPVVSTYSKGIENMFKDIVFMGETKESFSNEFNKLLEDNYYYNTKAHIGLREVLENHTYEERLIYILEKAGLNVKKTYPCIHVFSFVEDINELKYVLNMFINQRYKFKKLTFILEQSFDYSLIKEYKNLDIEVIPKINVEKKITNQHFDYFSYFSKRNFYGKNFLNDMYLATKYSDSDIIGKGSYYEYSSSTLNLQNTDSRYVYVNDLNIDAALVKKNVFLDSEIKELIKSPIKEGSLKFLFKKGYRLFSIDNYNFIRNLDFNSFNKVNTHIDF